MGHNLSINIGRQVATIAVARIVGDTITEQEASFDLSQDVIQLGYQFGRKSYFDELLSPPQFLAFYPELKSDWLYGADAGHGAAEVENCHECQNPDRDMCSFHDR